MTDWIKALISNGAVWSAVILLINTVLFYVVPAFPKEIWAAVNALVIAILAALGVSIAKGKVATIRSARKARAIWTDLQSKGVNT